MKKILMILLLTLTLYGCWDYHEVEDFVRVAGVAIDKGENKRLKVTTETNRYPTGQSNDPVQPVLYSIEADTIFEALRATISESGRKLYLGQTMAIVISEEVAKEGILEIFDFFIRDPETRLTMNVFIARGSSAKDIITDTATQEPISSYELDKMIDNTRFHTGLKKNTVLYKLYNEIFEPGVEVVIPAVSIKDLDEKKKTSALTGLACFKDDKLVGYIDIEYVPYFSSFIGEYDLNVVSVPLGKDNYMSCEIMKSKTKQKVKFINDQFHLFVTIEVIFTMGGNATNEEISMTKLKPDDLEYYFALDRKQKILELIEYIRNNIKTDVFGLENAAYHLSHKNWKKNKDSYNFLQDTVIHIEVKAKYYSAGRIKLEEGELHG